MDVLHLLVFIIFSFTNVQSIDNITTQCLAPMILCDQNNGKGGLCYPEQWKCDGHPDCLDHSDEPETCEQICQDHEFKCQTGKCLPRGFLCDGENDCGKLPTGDDDLSDEAAALCNQPIICDVNEYHCSKSSQCIHLKKFCDGSVDCDDGSDEHTMCHLDDPTSRLNCTYGAAMTLDGLKCYCPHQKFFSDATKSCEFVDYCRRSQNGHRAVCTQNCENQLNGSYECSCLDPRMKLVNGSTCVSRLNVAHPDIAILTNNNYIVLRDNNTDKFSCSSLMIQRHNAITLAYQLPNFDDDAEHSPAICYTETSAKSNVSLIVCTSLESKTTKSYWSDLNLDAINHILYDNVGSNWILSDGKHFITICSHRNDRITKCHNILIGNVGDIRDIQYDPISAVLFYIEVELANQGIWKVDVANGIKHRLTHHPISASAIAIDPFTRNVFIADVTLDNIRSIDYDNKYPPRIIISKHKSKMTTSMVYAEGKLFVSQGNSRFFMYDTMKSDGQTSIELKDPKLTMVKEVIKMVSFRKFENYWKWKDQKLCDNAKCDDICIGSWTNRTRCLCEDGSVQNGNKCQRIDEKSIDRQDLLVLAQMRPTEVIVMGFDDNNRTKPIGIPTIKNVKRPSAVTINIKHRTILIYDQKKHSIIERGINDQHEKMIPIRGVWNCEGMAYDPNADNLYLTDQGRQAIVVIRPNQPNRFKIIAHGNMSNPRAIVLHLAKSYVFWGSWSERLHNGALPKIERAKLDGSQRKTLVSRNAIWINGMTIDVENDFLYWCDAFRNVIERVRINGADRKIIVEGVDRVNHPYGLAFHKSNIYWSEYKTGKVKKIEIVNNDGSKTIETILTSNATIFELSVFSTAADVGATSCTNNQCKTDFCFSSSCKGVVGCQPIKCDCADGRKLTSKGECVEDVDWIDPFACNLTTQFECKINRKCIPLTSICDGDDDCGDGSDEDQSTTCKNFRCTGERHKCDGTTCLPLQWVCDGTRECQDGSDESDETCRDVEKKCVGGAFRCSNTTCISMEQRCDGFDDCADGRDETDCKYPKFCDITEFRCGNGKCIEQWQVCDGIKNCLDGLDEAHCNENCISGRQFRCKSGSECLDNIFRCDGVADCPDASDESPENCKQSSGADPCTMSNQFKCADGKCIRAAHLCDGVADCLTGEDETECPASMCNQTTNFVCRGGKKCVSKELECDGVDDCGNNSDEEHCEGVRKSAAESRCQYPMYRCVNDQQFVCISDKQLCNGIKDCPDGDDEGMWCMDKCADVDRKCSHSCRSTPFGPICTCPPNYYLDNDGLSCTKKDPCRFGQCSQLCAPRGSSKFCYCEDGFKLQNDRFSCVSDDPHLPFIVYTNRHEIRTIQQSIPGSSPIINKLTNAIALDYKFNQNGSISIYWSDLSADQIYSGLIENRVIRYQSIIVSYGVFNAEGIAVDWVTGNIYWIDSSLDSIQVASSDGLKRSTIISENMSNPRSLSIDAKHGLMFWTDWQQSRPRIERSTMAGNDRRIIWEVKSVSDAGWLNGIACDTFAQRIYWVDARSDSIHTIMYDGSGHVEVVRNPELLGHPFGIDVFQNFVYFSDWRTNTINRVNKWNGTDFGVVERVSSQPFSLKIVHRAKQNRFLVNPCQDMKCNGICLLDGFRQAKCRCTDFQHVNPYQQCENIDQFLLVINRNTIRGYSLSAHPSHFPLISGRIYDVIRNVQSRWGQLLIVDSAGNYVISQNLTSAKVRNDGILINGFDLIGVNGIAVDSKSGTIYLSVSTDKQGFIEAVSSDGTLRRSLITSHTNAGLARFPRDLVLIEKSAKLIWFDDRSAPSRIYSMNSDGSNPIQTDVNSTLAEKSFHPVVNQNTQRVYWVSNGKLASFDTVEMRISEIDVPDRQGNLSTVTIDPIDNSLLIGEMSTKLNRTIVRKLLFIDQEMTKVRSQSNFTIPILINNAEPYFLSTMSMRRAQITRQCSKCPICLRSASNQFRCECPQGHEMINGICQRSRKILFYVTDDGMVNSVGWDPKDQRRQIIGMHVLHSDIARQRVVRIVVDGKRDLLYAVTRQNEVWMCSINGSFAQQIFVATSHRIAAITIDRVTGYLLISARVTSSSRGVLFLMDPMRYKQNIQIILLEDVEKVPYEVAVDPSKGKIFWASSKCIKSANYDGSNQKCLISKSASTIEIDEKMSRLCYVVNQISAIDCVDYDGLNEQRNVVMFKAQGIGEPVNFVINGDELYLFDKFNMSGTIIQHRRTDRQTFEPIASMIKMTPRMKMRLFDVDIIDDSNSVPYTACSNQNGGCEHLCLTIPNGSMVQKKCECVHSMMGEHGNCIPSQTFIAFTRYQKSIEFASPIASNLSPPNRRITSDECHISKAGPVAADLYRRRIYYADYEKFRISSVNFDGTGCFVIAEDVGIIPSIAYDEVHQDLYYIRVNPAGIWRIDLSENDMEKYPIDSQLILLLTIRDRPRHIVLHPCRMLLFFSNNAITGAVIERIYFSGYQRKVIIQEDLNDVRGLAIDVDAEKIYFSDAKDFRISRCDYDGSHRETVISNSDLDSIHPFELAIYNDQIIFTDWIRRSITSINKISGMNNETILISSDIPVSLTIVDPNREYCGNDSCLNNQLECEDYCRIMPNGDPTCGCNGERRLNSDNRTCDGKIDGKKCAENEFACMTSDRCISYEETCDGYNDCPINDDEDVKYCSTRQCRPGYFSCGSGMCIAESKVCNRVNDCFNFADEQNCTCSESEFKCDSGFCIPKKARCDFKQDCADASDEKGCPFRNCSGLIEHGLAGLINCATTSQCILPSWKCDGTNDCYDGWDERDCLVDFDSTGRHVSPPKECNNRTHFACLATRTCMPIHWKCDGQIDCADESDEQKCETKCNSFEFFCSIDKSCIPIEQKCDGTNDCFNGEDEADCKHNECKDEGNSTFRCTNHRCIPMSWRCDGTDDCMDNASSMGSDEINCGGQTSWRLPSHCLNETCDVACELTAILCDGIADCLDGFDEKNCASLDRQCGSNQWMCNNGQCIPSKQLCDGSVECLDGSDEWVDICSLSEPPKRGCPNGWSCILKNGTIGCLEEKQLCDGRRDCMSGIDEDCSLPQGNCTTIRNNCDQAWNCERRAGFEKCSCDAGYYLSAYDQTTCHRSPSCPSANCSHFCVDRRDVGHECVCASGFILDENRRDCRRNDSIDAEILLVFGHRLKLFTLEGHSKATLLANLTNGVAVDYDIKTDLVYWTEINHNENKVGVVSINNQPNSYRLLHTLPTKGIDGIAIDWLGRNIYFTDRHQDLIAICDMRGRFHRVLLKGNPLNDPRAIVLDPLESLVFWTDWGTSAHIGRMNMDGSDVQVLLQDRTIRWPNALAVDAAAKRLYFGDAHRDYIGSCDYDGTRRRIVLRNVVRHIFALTVFENFIYWSDWHNHTIERAHKITGDHRTVLIHDKQYRPMGFKIIHPSLQSLGSRTTAIHACSQPARCDNLCVPKKRTVDGDDDDYSCVCADGFRSEGRSCVSECKPLDMVCTGTYKCIASWWRCDGQDDCGDGEDEGYFKPGVCPEFPCESGQFVCKSSRTSNETTTTTTTTTCLYASKLCDGNVDCPLGDDEESKFCEHFECAESYFKCSNNQKCIPMSAVCDAHNDCADASDEKDCKIKNCDPGFFACLNGTSSNITKCIPIHFYCDGEADCPQGQDEPDTCEVKKCSTEEFRCNNGICVPKARRCDGESDCRDGSDEMKCDQQHQCAWQCDQKCLSIDNICDGKVDCLIDENDESEEACAQRSIHNETCRFSCSDGSGCYSRRCDGIIDCNNGEDEQNCENEAHEKCLLDKMSKQICNGIVDCDNGIDEYQCDRNDQSIPISKPFNCSNQSISHWQLCDGHRDCADGQDEQSTECNQFKADCQPSRKCGDGSQCFDLSSGLCDGIKDCRDGSDEREAHCPSMCQNKFRCTNGRCINESGRCDGRLDCDDKSDEEGCGIKCHHFGTCSQLCIKVHHNLTECGCHPGFISDKRSEKQCIPTSNFTELIISNGRKMHWFMIPIDKSSNKLAKIQDIQLKTLTSSIDFLYDSQKTIILYGVDNKIRRSDIRQIVLADQLEWRRHNQSIKSSISKKWFDSNVLIAYDHFYRNVYFTEPKSDRSTLLPYQEKIFVARRNDTSTRTLIVTSTGVITSLAVSPEHNRLFWSTSHPAAQILTSTLDGKPIDHIPGSAQKYKPLVMRHIFDPKSVKTDSPNMRIYWIDGFKRTIETVTLDGEDRRIVRKFNLFETPITLDILADDIFLITNTGNIHRMHKFTGHSTIFDKRLDNVSPFVSVRVANPSKVHTFLAEFSQLPCRNDDVCPAENVCVPQITERKKLQASCLCGPDRYFEESTKKCQAINDKNAEASQCGDYFCYNGAECNKMHKVCICPPGFYGQQCEIDRCSEKCWNGAKCAIQMSREVKEVQCHCHSNYTNEACSTHICDGVCGPRGTCRFTKTETNCECDEGFHGPQCQYKIIENPCDGHCFNGGKCSRSSNMELKCQCPTGYDGSRCENCQNSLQCQNGGFCRQKIQAKLSSNDDLFECFCPLGFGGKNCEIDLCQDKCPIGHKCVYNQSLPNPIQCICQKSAVSLNSNCEPICDREKQWCRNGGTCFDLPGRPGVCKCPPAFTGPRCDQPVRCDEYCMNDSDCLIVNSTHYECVCPDDYAGNRCENYKSCVDSCQNGGTCLPTPPGSSTCVCPKGVGGSKCTKIVATSCGSLECANGGICATVLMDSNRPACICPPGWGGLVCRVHTCQSFCHHGGTCFLDENDNPTCRCKDDYYGQRCETWKSTSNTSGESKNISRLWRSILWFFIAIIGAVLISGGYILYNSDRINVFRQFRHAQMEEVGAPLDQFTNPAYLIDEGGSELVSASTSLVSTTERTAFNNPVFEQEMVPIYNDTVENTELLRNNQ